MKSPNKFAPITERLHVSTKLPKLLSQHHKQQRLNKILNQTLANYIAKTACDGCHIVQFANGKLIVATPHTTLVNHMTYLSDNLIADLKRHLEFKNLTKLHWVVATNPLNQ